MDDIWEILGGLFLVALVIGGFMFLFGGEREGTVSYSDCRQMVQLQPDTLQQYYKKFTCSYSKTQSGKIMSGECVHVSNDNAFLGNTHSCATAFVYQKEQDPACKNDFKDGIFYPYLGYNDNCYTEPQGGETYIDSFSLPIPNLASSSVLPTEIGQCSKTTITKIGTRFDDNPSVGGTAIEYANGGYQVSYDTIWGSKDSVVGDEVYLCLISLPENCPAGDERGKVYSSINLRNGKYWQAQDSQHSCGGA